MKMTIQERLLRRSIGEKPPKYTKVRDFYGDRAWVDDLDIINELGGHTGCVNALSWSRSGQFLASGSDDTYLNIWSYNPDSIAKPFSLSTSISTGHVANIFGVKFAPHSNDRTLITCAGDAQVRVFDIEYGGNYGNASRGEGLLDSTRSRRFQNFFSNARFLNEGNTNARVYRSHGERVKRIVTESSPHTFLTCSEDGEVRQWDLRQPSSAYPAPRGGGQASRGHRQCEDLYADNVPPPLISYKKFSLDLNSISCAASQPYYIVLGGVHSHCFLHDRRMLGRSLAAERGQTSGLSPGVDSHDDAMMDQATRCVRRFAPNDKLAMGTHDNGHVTACKISDANPNELIASWSGDHIYSFDIVQSPDARDAGIDKERTLRESHTAAQQYKDRKRKRTKASSSANPSELSAAKMHPRSSAQSDGRGASVRVRYGNGQSEMISVNEDVPMAESAPDFLLNEAQKLSQRIARSLVQLRKSVFDFETTVQDTAGLEGSSELTPHTATFTSVLGQAAALLPQIDEVIRDWSYPVNPSSEDVMLQNTLRLNRQASRRFVQASGCLAAAMGARLQTSSSIPDPRLSLFERIEPAQREGTTIDDNQRFCYDFLKTILLWLSAGRDAVAEAFCKQSDRFRDSQRFPLSPDDGPEAIDSKLVPYLLDLAQDDKPVLNVDANRFETQEPRTIFQSQVAAVNAFAGASKDLRPSSRNMAANTQPSEQGYPKQILDVGAACRFWGCKVGRSLLMEAGEGVNYEFVKRAFGGLRISVMENSPTDRYEAINTDDEHIEGVDVVENSHVTDEAADGPIESVRIPQAASEGPEMSTRTRAMSANRGTIITESSGTAGTSEESDNESDDDNDDVNSSTSDHQDSDNEESGFVRPLFRPAIGFGGSKERARVEFDKPYSSHTRVYKGHCNCKTVKDVGFYGLNDEYVVSGSDSGHVFIWDRKTTQVVNILEGDGEIVNVVTGHPYEPMIAVSGIDSTIKLFSPDNRLQEDAREGIDIAKPSEGAAMHSSLRTGSQRRRPDQPTDASEDGSPVRLTSKKAMHKCYEIMSQNDVHRRDGVGEAYLTRGMLARLAAHLHSQGNGDGNAVIIDDQCNMM